MDKMSGGRRNPALTVDGIVIYEGKLVLIERGREPFKGMHALPGGFVEYGERVEAAVIREVREETGLETEIVKFHGIYSDPGRDPRGHTVSAVYEMKPVGGDLRAGDDATRVKLFDLDELPELAFDHGLIMSDYKAETEG